MTRSAVHAGCLAAGLLSFAAPAFAAPQASAATTPTVQVEEGVLQTLVEDYADGRSRTLHYLDTPHGRYAVRFRGKPAMLPSGTRVRARVRAQGNVLELDGAGDVQVLAAASAATLGEQRVAVILVNFSDDATQPRTAAEAGALVLGTVSSHYRESSFGQTWFSGQVFGYYTVPMSKGTCDPYKLASLADAAASAAGASLGGFNRKLYMFPRNACTWSGLGNVGGASTQAWVNGSFSTLVAGHELGHNYGLRHAQSMDCDTGPLGKTCTTITYGDTADMMGNYRAAHFNPFEKELLGWLNDGVSPPITTVAASGRYRIEPYSAASLGPKAIRIPRGNGNYYYLEYRQPIGFDSVLATTGNLTRGVIVRTGSPADPASSRQLDMTPGTSTTSSYTELADGALEVGRSYTDAAAGITLSLAAADSTGASIDVGLGSAPAPTCTRSTPMSSLSGPSTAVAAGTTQTYTVTLANRDSSACAATTFSLAQSIPSGWSGVLASSSLALSPGASATTTLKVTSPATAGAGSYGVGVGVGSNAGSVHTASASASYAVAAPAGTLSGTVATDKATYAKGETAYLTAMVKNDGVPVAGASVSFVVTLPNGSTTTLSGSSAGDGIARASYRIGKGKAAVGPYSVRANAVKGSTSASSSTGFRVQ